MSFKTCLRYGHTVKTCRETIAACMRCISEGRNKDKCTSTEVRCCHYGADHQAFPRNNPIFKREKQIAQFQTKESIPRLQAIQKLLRLNLIPEIFFSNAVMDTSNTTTSKPPTRSEQESRSCSSEGTNETHFFFSKTSIMKKTTHCLDRPTATDTILREKKKKRSPPLLPLTVGCVGTKRAIK